MKTKEELNALKGEVEAWNKKLAERSEEELKQVVGGFIPPYGPSLAPVVGGEKLGDQVAFFPGLSGFP